LDVAKLPSNTGCPVSLLLTGMGYLALLAAYENSEP